MWLRRQYWLELAEKAQAEKACAHVARSAIATGSFLASLYFLCQPPLSSVTPAQDLNFELTSGLRFSVGLKTFGHGIAGKNYCHGLPIYRIRNSWAFCISAWERNLFFEVGHEFRHAYDFGFRFVIDHQLAEVMVAADLSHHVLLWSSRLAAPNEPDDCRKPFFPGLLGKR